MIPAFVRMFFGDRAVRSRHVFYNKLAARSFLGIKYFKHHADAILDPPRDDDSAPIFILSAGWRSGSTLLQRMVCSSLDTIIWGEPYAYCDLVPTMSAQLLPFCDNWPNLKRVSPDTIPNLKDAWIANLYPKLSHFHAAHKCFFERMFGTPAIQAGYKYWGFKEVRLTIHDAAYLRWLFPQCKILLLVRNPYDAYASYKSVGWKDYRRWPSRPVFTPWQFGKMWAEYASGFQAYAAGIGALLLRYEDLNSPQSAEAIGAYLGRTIPLSTEMKKTGRAQKSPLNPIERALLTVALGKSTKTLGYSPS